MAEQEVDELISLLAAKPRDSPLFTKTEQKILALGFQLLATGWGVQQRSWRVGGGG
jgi:hypothetical protein